MQSELKALAERVMARTGPCRWEDANIHQAVAGFDARRAGPGWPNEDEYVVPMFPGWKLLPSYTSSLDAAMTLVPEGCSWVLPFCNPWQARIVRGGEVMLPLPRHGAPTPALALTAAALLALAEQVQQ